MTLSKQDKVTITGRVVKALFDQAFKDAEIKLNDAAKEMREASQKAFENIKACAPNSLKDFMSAKRAYIWDIKDCPGSPNTVYYADFEGVSAYHFSLRLENNLMDGFLVNPNTNEILCDREFLSRYNTVYKEAKNLAADLKQTAEKTELILSSVSTLNQLLETWPAARTSVPREMFTREEERKKREKERREQAKRERVLREQKRKLELEEKLQDISDLDTRIFAASLAGDLDG